MLQAVSPSGAVTTVAHMAVAGLGLSRQRALYVVTDSEVGHFDGDELKTLVRAAQFKGLSGVPPLGSLDFGNVDADGAGDLYISGTGDGYNLYELTKTGHARFVSPFRGANGKRRSLEHRAGRRRVRGVAERDLPGRWWGNIASPGVFGRHRAQVPRHLPAGLHCFLRRHRVAP